MLVKILIDMVIIHIYGYNVMFQYFYTVYDNQAKVIGISIASCIYHFAMLGTNSATCLEIFD